MLLVGETLVNKVTAPYLAITLNYAANEEGSNPAVARSLLGA